MAKRRSKKVYHKENALEKAIPAASFVASFIAQANGKDRAANSSYSSLSLIDKLQWEGTNAISRLTKPVNLNGVINQYTGLGLAIPIFAKVAQPFGIQTPKELKKASKGLLWGGILGGLFDNPPSQTSNSNSYASQASYMATYKTNDTNGDDVLA